MIKLYPLFIAGIALALSGCIGLPFFLSEPAPHNPVPRTDWAQADSASDPRNAQETQREAKRTPSLVWLPENRVNRQTAATRSTRVADTTGNPVLTGFSDCLNTGYALLDGTDCGVIAEGDNGPTSPQNSEDANISGLATDLLGTPSEPDAADNAVQALKNTPTSVAETKNDMQHNDIQPQPMTSGDAEERVAIRIASARLIPASYERLVVTSDVLFEFTKFGLDGLSDAGQLALRGLLDRFAKYDKTSLRKVIITGHSDRLGNASSNIKVSEKRASSVKAFLIGAGIDADILTTAGVGSVAPIKHCTGKSNKASNLKTCLAPNRRVEIEIIGAT